MFTETRKEVHGPEPIMRSLGAESFDVPLLSVSSSWDGNEDSLRVGKSRLSSEAMLKTKRNRVELIPR
jgi:hypothetical protein